MSVRDTARHIPQTTGVELSHDTISRITDTALEGMREWQHRPARRAEVDGIWRQRLERADFACDRARRQYQLTEPENRLVARQLEREWEAALAERAHLGEEYKRHQRARPAVARRAGRDPRPGRRHPGAVGRAGDHRG
jgi:hypothetical protein